MTNTQLGWSRDLDFLLDVKLPSWPVNRQTWLQTQLRKIEIKRQTVRLVKEGECREER